MPTEVDKLTSASKIPQIKAAISDCIATEVHGGMEQSQAVATCHSMAAKKTGRPELSKPKG